MAIQPSRISIPQADLDDLRNRLSRTRWPDEQPVDDWSQGAPLHKIQKLTEYWLDRYDWRRCERMLNSWNPNHTTIDGVDVHFFHLKSPEPDALPLIITHGWPGSVIEFHKVAAALTNPVAFGGSAADAFHLVLPCLPGYGFSGKPQESGWSLVRIASAWIELMDGLGYGDRWAAQGGDWGAQVTAAIGSAHPGGCIGIHLNGLAWKPTRAEIETADEQERALLKRGHYYEENLSGYNKEQSTRPQTLGYALSDSPAGQAAWIYEKLHDWTDNDGSPEDLFSFDEMLDNIMLYWLPNAGASSARRYWENARDDPDYSPVDIPLAFSSSPKDIGGVSKRWAQRRFKNIVRWSEVAKGGHFAAFEQPQLFVDEVRAGFRTIRDLVTEGVPRATEGAQMKDQIDESINVLIVQSTASRPEEQRISVERLTEITPEARDLLQEYYLAINVVQRDEPGALQLLTTDSASGVWLAFSGPEAVGCVVLRRLDLIPNSSECKRLYVKPSARGLQVATSLLDAQETYALQKGLKWIYLDTYDDLDVAIALYKKRGYQQCPRYNDNPQATIFMRKQIF